MKKLILINIIFCFILRGYVSAQPVNKFLNLMSLNDTAASKFGWEMVFFDEFEEANLDEKKWWAQMGPHGLELQYYTPRPENVYVADGLLHLRAVKEAFVDSLPYTSGMVVSSVEFGKNNLIEVRCKIPKGKGLWPAFWFWSGFNKVYQELDVFEFWSSNTKSYWITNHWNEAPGAPIKSEPYEIKPLTSEGEKIDMSTVFMTYSIYWDDDNILFLLNHQLVAKIKNNIPTNTFPIILNLAVDNGNKKRPNNKTVFPAEFVIDYVRAYKRVNDNNDILQR